MRLVAAVVLVAGCQVVFDLDTVSNVDTDGGRDGGKDGGLVDAAPACFEDMFPPPDLDITKWSPFTNQSTTVSVDGRLVISLDSTSGDAYAGVTSLAPRDVRNDVTEVEVVSISPVEVTGADAYMMWTIDTQNAFKMGVDGSSIYFDVIAQGARSSITAAYLRADPERFWRIEHTAGGTVQFWTRTETGSWQLRRETPTNADLKSAKFELAAGTRVDFNTPGTASFDNFRVICR